MCNQRFSSETSRPNQLSLTSHSCRHVLNAAGVSCPISGVLQLLTEASLSRQHADWSSSGPQEENSPSSLLAMDLISPFPPLLNACGPLAYTNYVGGFQGCLDYIFIQPHSMRVEQVVPMPAHHLVTTYTALPSVAHPSDHIALVCDLHWDP